MYLIKLKKHKTPPNGLRITVQFLRQTDLLFIVRGILSMMESGLGQLYLSVIVSDKGFQKLQHFLFKMIVPHLWCFFIFCLEAQWVKLRALRKFRSLRWSIKFCLNTKLATHSINKEFIDANSKNKWSAYILVQKSLFSSRVDTCMSKGSKLLWSGKKQKKIILLWLLIQRETVYKIIKLKFSPITIIQGEHSIKKPPKITFSLK